MIRHIDDLLEVVEAGHIFAGFCEDIVFLPPSRKEQDIQVKIDKGFCFERS
jgi:hypothetical protein